MYKSNSNYDQQSLCAINHVSGVRRLRANSTMNLIVLLAVRILCYLDKRMPNLLEIERT